MLPQSLWRVTDLLVNSRADFASKKDEVGTLNQAGQKMENVLRKVFFDR